MAARDVSLWEATCVHPAGLLSRACSAHEPPYSDRFS
jgi:hypothetical protein